MHPIPGKRLVPTFLVVFATTLLGLIAAAPPRQADDDSGGTAPGATSLTLPWEPLSSPPPELAVVSRLLSTTPAKERLVALTRLARDTNQAARTRGIAAYAAGAMLAGKSRSAEAVELLQSPDISATGLVPYALDVAADELASTAPATALGMLQSLVDRFPDYPESDSVRLRLAALLESAGERERAVQALLPATGAASDSIRGKALDELSKLLVKSERPAEAVAALETLYYELPRHDRARAAGRRLTALREELPEVEPLHLYRLALGRAELLMASRRYREAYDAFASIPKRFPDVADNSLVRLRMGTCQYLRRQITASIQNFKRVESDTLVPEALYYRAEVERRKRRLKSYRALVTELETRFPNSPWTEKAWFSLGRHLQSEDQDAEARAVYERMASRFPQGEHLLDARWRLAWDDFGRGAFEAAAMGLRNATRERPGASGRSRFLYWAGRSFQEAGRMEPADELYRQVLLGYQNSYYGRQATKRLAELGSRDESLGAVRDARSGIDLSDAFRVERRERQQRVAELFAAGHPKAALADAKHAVDGSGDEAAFRAMAAWLHTNQGSILQTIITIRDAFPFHVSATGDLLPRPIWELFYPMPYREHIDRYAAERGLDPYLVAGLIRQESTFNPRVRSSAGARGLMQIIPSTGRQLARQERRQYRTRDLHNPEINIRYGTRYLKEVMGRFDGRVDYALASYNAGPHRVKRWTDMDMSIDPEVFIEEIPFRETRNYVKLVLRNEMLYRRLYGDTAAAPAVAPVAD